MRCLRPDGAAVILTVRLTPRANRDGVDGLAELADGSVVLKVRVRAVPEDGAANEALIRTLAKGLDMPRTRLELVSGATQRVKHVRMDLSPEDAARRINAWMAN